MTVPVTPSVISAEIFRVDPDVDPDDERSAGGAEGASHPNIIEINPRKMIFFMGNGAVSKGRMKNDRKESGRTVNDAHR